ncbi:GMP synthase (glutamine-hydrolyzing) [Methanohalophilus levihalophilus]|uniref:GMP synthase subunit A n=1 Tax=Methanohalophilus levihalophilus TaxID=1431282 RepID=UPI001AE9EBF6|nr:GMP synthase subunit A [Methanohalophilus levihalophilus]MBP2030108.1 GMP synthase (glutamine-hydrolyzing) [Methanohalophilus levihalophilus]
MEELKILVINNYGQFCHLIHRTVRDLDMDTKIVPNTTPVDEILAMEPDGLVLSGGPSMERVGFCGDYVKEIDLPILGICLGHQLIALTFGGETGSGEYGGYADVDIEILEEDDILKGLGPKITTWASHADEVTVMPEEFIHLARSEICEVEAMKHPKKPIYGVQWHPEVAHTESGEALFMNFFEVCEKHKKA